MRVALSWARLTVLPFSGVELRDLRCLFECMLEQAAVDFEWCAGGVLRVVQRDHICIRTCSISEPRQTMRYPEQVAPHLPHFRTNVHNPACASKKNCEKTVGA